MHDSWGRFVLVNGVQGKYIVNNQGSGLVGGQFNKPHLYLVIPLNVA